MLGQQRGKMGGGSGLLSGTQRELSAEFAGGALKSMGTSRIEPLTAAGDVEGGSHGLRGRTDHAFACRNFHVVDAT